MDPEDDVAGTIRDETAAEMVEQPIEELQPESA
jgi:hypothetical protein